MLTSTVLVLTLATASFASGVLQQPIKRPPYEIPDGQYMKQVNIPFLVAITSTAVFLLKPECSGVIIKPSVSNRQPIIATTASCLKYYGATSYRFRVESETCNIKTVHYPEPKSSDIYIRDVAVLIPEDDCQIDMGGAISLISKNSPIPYTTNVGVSGWDTRVTEIDPKILFQSIVLEKLECFQKFLNNERLEGTPVFCMGVKEGQQGYRCEAQGGSPVVGLSGDNGGPFVLGLASWTYETFNQAIYPCVVTDLADPVINDFIRTFL